MIDLRKSGLNWKSIALTLFLLLMVVGGIWYVKKPQDIRNKAALSGAVLSMNPSSAKKAAGTTFPIAVILNAGPYSVTGAEIHVQYNPAVLEITGFSTGKPLPVVLTQPVISSGKASVTLGAQPNSYLKGSDIIGTFTVKALSETPASITFTTETLVSALEKTTNALVSSSGVALNGVEPSPVSMKCDGPDGSECALGSCPTGAMCKLQTGICKAGVCRQTVTMCDASNTGSYCKRCQPCPEGRACTKECKLEFGVCNNSSCEVEAPSGCYYKQVQCVQAPCDPILVCPTPAINSCTNARNGATCTVGSCPTMPPCPPGKMCPQVMPACKLQSGTCQNGQCVPGNCIPLPECVYNPPIVNGRPVVCDVAPPPNGMSYCPRPTVSPTPTTHNWCPGPNGSTCAWDCNTCNAAGGCTKMKCPAVTGTCQNNTCVKPTATPTPTPYTQAGCYRGGCNSELCVSDTSNNAGSTCIAKPQFACYRSARCEKQANGACGWTQTNELTQCLAQFITPTPTPTITSTPTGTPTGAVSQTIEIRVRMAGVTDGSAEGAKIAVKFIKIGGETLQLSSPLSLTHIGSGVYKATATLTNPLVAGARYRMKVKGEKHVSVEYCKLVGQTGPCADADYMNGTAGTTIVYDFTTLPLPPGDVSPQDGKVDVTDFNTIKSLMSKLCSELTVQDKLKADLDYNGCVTVKDIFLIRQTLETRYDE